MPPHFQPPSLQDLSVYRVAEMVFRSCIVIERKYGRLEWSTSQQQEVSDLQGFLLSTIGHLFNEVCNAINDLHIFKCKEKPLIGAYKWKYNLKNKWKYSHLCHDKLNDFRIYSSVLVHDTMRRLKFHRYTFVMFKNEISLSECQIEKLSSVVELNILDVILTDKVIEGIGRACTNLQTIRLSLDASHSLESVCNSLLKCREIQWLEIEFEGWSEEQYNPFIIKLVTELPKIQVFNFCVDDECDVFLPRFTSVTSLQTLNVKADANEFKHILQMCPHVKDLYLISCKYGEDQELVNALAHSSLEIETLELAFMTLGETMNSLLELKGCNLTVLILDHCTTWRETTLDDIYTIARNCPKLEQLDIMKYGDDQGPMTSQFNLDPHVPQTSTITASHMFPNLKDLHLRTVTLYELRLLLPILMYTNSLEFLVICVEYEGTRTHGFHDILADILNVNALPELVVLKLQFSTQSQRPSPWTSRASIKHLVNSCPKLYNLELLLPLKDDAISYIKELEERIEKENFDLRLYATDCSLGLPSEDSVYESYFFIEPDSDLDC